MLKYFIKYAPLGQRSSTAISHAFMFARTRILVSILSVLCVLCGYSSAQEWKSVADGVEYAEVRREFSGKSVNINLLRLDLKKVRLDVHHALDKAIGVETTSSIATRHKAFAAINAGFFRLDKTEFAGDPVGAFQIDGKTLSEPTNDRVAIVIDNPSIFMGIDSSGYGSLLDAVEVRFGFLKAQIDIAVGKKVQRVDGVNRERRVDDFVVYTPEFGNSTLTKDEGVEILVDNRRILRIVRGKGNNEIPRYGFVISISGKSLSKLLNTWRVNSVAVLKTQLYLESGSHKPRPVELLNSVEDIVAGVPQLIKDSKIDITWEQEKSSKAFVETRHPRTAVAKLKDGKFLMLTADGRTEQSAGLDLYDLAAYFLELGATDAMNLDGGGSTTMFLDGKVVNRPSDKEGERKVSDAILVTLRKPVKRK